MRKLSYLFIILATAAVSSCKKSGTGGGTGPVITEPTKTGSTFDLIRDSVFLYAKEAYYWNDGLPSYADFNPRGITGSDELTALSNEVDKISQYKINPATGVPFEFYSAAPGSAKYSFIDDGSVSAELNGVKGDFGFAPLYNTNEDLRIKYVYPGSPADLAGIKRGYQITSINGRTNLTYDGGGSGANLNFLINAYANSSTIALVLRKPDGTSMNATLNVATYTLNPVMTSKVFDLGNGHKVGYFVFNSFTSEANAVPKLNAVFADFATQGVTDLVVDFRYNGGGFVSTAEYLTNLIAPSTKTSGLMYNTYFNSLLTSGNAKILKNQVRKDPTNGQLYNYSQFSYAVDVNATNFSKAGISTSLNLGSVFFIVTGSTASASELTINNLKPIMPVKLIGTTSYGKPVGFFDININKYQMYICEFETKNSADQGGYYAGMAPETNDYPGKRDRDDPTRDFGDPDETLLAHALKYVKTGAFNVTSPVIQSVGGVRTYSAEESREVGIRMDDNKFKGMVFDKSLKLKK